MMLYCVEERLVVGVVEVEIVVVEVAVVEVVVVEVFGYGGDDGIVVFDAVYVDL